MYTVPPAPGPTAVIVLTVVEQVNDAGTSLPLASTEYGFTDPEFGSRITPFGTVNVVSKETSEPAPPVCAPAAGMGFVTGVGLT